MASLESAMAKYARKTQAGAAKYNAAKGRMKSNYAAGVARFIGQPVAGHILSSYSAGIDAAQYVAGDPNKWRANYVAAMTGQ